MGEENLLWTRTLNVNTLTIIRTYLHLPFNEFSLFVCSLPLLHPPIHCYVSSISILSRTFLHLILCLNLHSILWVPFVLLISVVAAAAVAVVTFTIICYFAILYVRERMKSIIQWKLFCMHFISVPSKMENRKFSIVVIVEKKANKKCPLILCIFFPFASTLSLFTTLSVSVCVCVLSLALLSIDD